MTVYLNEDPAICVCQGKGEYWAVGEHGQSLILNVFPAYRRDDGTLVAPDFLDLDQMLITCRYHRAAVLSFADYEMLSAAGVALPSGSLPSE